MNAYHRTPGFFIWTVCGILVTVYCGMAVSFGLLVSSAKMTWVSAINFCHENNGSLIILDTQDKWDNFTMENQQCHGGQIGVESTWIAMSTSTGTCQDFQWLNNNSVTWTNWEIESAQPIKCSTRRCVKIRRKFMRTAVCSNPWLALCETDFSVPCMSSGGSTDISLTTVGVPYITEPSTTESMTTGTYDLPHVTSPSVQHSMAITTSSTADNNTVTSTTVSNGTSTSNEYTTKIDDDVHTTNTMRCCCSTNKLTPLTPEDLLAITTATKEKLTVLKSNTSVNRRKLISVYDSRPSSVLIGTTGCVVLLLVLCLIVVPDLLHLARHILSMNRKERITCV